MGLAAKALHLEEAQPGVERVSDRRGGLCRPTVAEHPQRPRLAGENVSLAPGVLGFFGRRGDAGSEQIFARLCAHSAHSSAGEGAGK